MEMQQEFHCVNMNGAASDALELSSSTSSNSTSTGTSSSQSSPDNNSSVPSPPIQSPPLLPATEQSFTSIPISAPAPAIPSAHLPPRHLTRTEALKSIKESIPHRMKLEKLQKSEMEHQKDASRHKKTVRRISKEVYLIVSLYALLQGALFTAVAQSSIFTCKDWWGPAGIVVLVTLGTISGVLDKLRRMGEKKEEVKKFERRQSAVYDKIEQLYLNGSACNIESLEPAHTVEFEEEPGILCIFSAHGLLVMGFLVGFSTLIMASCTQMLCRPCHCK